MTKLKRSLPARKIADLFRVLGQPARLRILQAIGNGEACVCHLEAALGYRQAYISQHLMALREAQIVSARRDGRNIYYQVANPGLIALIQQAAGLLHISGEQVQFAPAGTRLAKCPCPHCETPPTAWSASIHEH